MKVRSSSATSPGGCWPTPTQQLLLRACLSQGEEALAAWQAWHQRTDFENLDAGSNRLLPLLWRNLAAQGVGEAQLRRYRSVGRHGWVKNQLLLAQAAHLLRALHSENIATIILKGGAIATLYYPDFAARPMDDFDILVPAQQAPRAFGLLIERGYGLQNWAHTPRLSARCLSVFHGNTFGKPGESKFDVHQHVLPHSHAHNSDEFWAASVALQINGVSTRALCAEDNFLHVCAHGARWNEVPPLRWIADATLIWRASPNFDWARLVAQTRRHQLAIPLRQSLRYLHEQNFVEVPAAILRQLSALPTHRAQRREWAAGLRPASSHSMALKLWLRARAYARWNATNSAWQRPFSLPRYLQFFWGLDGIAQVPAYGFARLRETIK